MKGGTLLKIINTIDILWDEYKFPTCTARYQEILKMIAIALEAYKIFFAFALLIHIILPIWQRSQIIITWLPFDHSLLETSLTHLLLTGFWQTITFGYAVWFSVIYSDCLFGLLLTAAILHFRLLHYAFRSLKNDCETSFEMKVLIVKYIGYHRLLIEYVC